MNLIKQTLPELVENGKFLLSEKMLELVLYDLKRFAQWVQGSCYLTTEGYLAFKIDWEYDLPSSEGLVTHSTTIRGLKRAKIVEVGNRGQRLIQLYDEGNENVMLANELLGTMMKRGGFLPSADGAELVFSSIRERDRALVQLAKDLDFVPRPEWVNPIRIFRSSLTAEDFSIKDPFYCEVTEAADKVEIYLVQNIAAEPKTAISRVKKLAGVWLTNGLNLGSAAPAGAVGDLETGEEDTELEVYVIENGKVIKKTPGEKNVILPKAIIYGPSRFGVLLDLSRSKTS